MKTITCNSQKDFLNILEQISNIDEDVHLILSDIIISSSVVLSNLKMKNLRISGSDSCFSGAETRKFAFKRYNDTILVTSMDVGLLFQRVMRDSKNLTMARFPNFDKSKLNGGYTTLAYAEKKAKNWTNKNGGFMRSIHNHEWGGNSYFIDNISENGNLNLTWLGDNNRGHDFKKSSIIVENIFEELDFEDEWYYDKKNGLLYLFDDSGFEGEIELKLLTNDCLLQFKNCIHTNIVIDGFKFLDTDRSMFKAKWQRYLRSDWAYNKISCVDIQDSANITIKNCIFDNLGNNAIGIFGNNREILIDNCDFTNSLTNGILILGDPTSTYCTSSWEGENHKTEMESPTCMGARNENYPKNVVINDCYFYNLGLHDKQSCAVCISLASGVSVKNSTIHGLPRSGINIGENAFGGHLIEGCDIFDCVRETGDHGPFNSWGRDRFWSLKKFSTLGKYGKFKKLYAFSDMFEKNIIRNNRIATKKGFGIDLDDGSSNYLIEKNLCVNTGIKLREGFCRTVKENIILNSQLDLHTTFYKNDDIITDNIIISKKPLNVIILNKGFNTTISNNLFVGSDLIHKKQAVLKNQANKWENGNFENYQNIIDGFPTSFGKSGKPSAEMTVVHNFNAVSCLKCFGAVLLSLDENIRSLTGAGDENGIYFQKISIFSKLRRLGFKKHDVLTHIDQTKVMFHNFDVKTLDGFKSATVIRNQKYLMLNS